MEQKKPKEEFEMGKALGRFEAEDKALEGQKVRPVPKELAEYSDDMTFQKEKVFDEIEFYFQHDVWGQRHTARARVEMGKRLILLHEMAGVPVLHGGDRRSKDFSNQYSDLKKELEERFPWLTKQKKSECILMARAAVENPKFKEWLIGGKNWAKGLALLSSVNEKEIKALEDGEPVQGMLFDDIDAMTVSEVKEKLRSERKKNERGKEQLEKKDEEIRRLQKFSKPTEEQFALLMEAERMTFDRLMNNLDPESIEPLRKANNPTVKMKAHYIELLGYMKKTIQAASATAEDYHGTAAMMPEKVWHPGKK